MDADGQREGVETEEGNLVCMELSDFIVHLFNFLNLYFLSSQSYAQSLEVSLASLRHRIRDQNAEVTALKTEIARTKYQKNINDGPMNEKDQRYRNMVEDATKVSIQIYQLDLLPR